MKKKLIILIFTFCCYLGFSYTLTCGRTADEICIGAYQYFLINNKMPESIENLKSDIYISNAITKFKNFDQYGYKYNLKKVSDKKIEIFVYNDKLKIRIIYEKEENHKFIKFYNDDTTGRIFYRDEKGTIY